VAVSLEGLSAAALEKAMRAADPPVIGRIESNMFLLDPRTIQEDEFVFVKDALEQILRSE
jgi:L-seryl-tRNA(Ser) seleniumtransferase